MVIKYKTIAFCKMCKKRYEVKKSKEFPFGSKYYCEECYKKHFKNK